MLSRPVSPMALGKNYRARHCERHCVERIGDRPDLWRGWPVERLLHALEPARLVGGGRWTSGPHLRAGDRRRRRRDAIARCGRSRRSRQVDLSAAVVLGAADVLRRFVVRLRHGDVERLRLARAGAARARQSPLLRGGGRARHFCDDDAEGPDRSGTHRHGAGIANHGVGEFGARIAIGVWIERRSRRAWWPRQSSARR